MKTKQLPRDYFADHIERGEYVSVIIPADDYDSATEALCWWKSNHNYYYLLDGDVYKVALTDTSGLMPACDENNEEEDLTVEIEGQTYYIFDTPPEDVEPY